LKVRVESFSKKWQKEKLSNSQRKAEGLKTCAEKGKNSCSKKRTVRWGPHVRKRWKLKKKKAKATKKRKNRRRRGSNARKKGNTQNANSKETNEKQKSRNVLPLTRNPRNRKGVAKKKPGREGEGKREKKRGIKSLRGETLHANVKTDISEQKENCWGKGLGGGKVESFCIFMILLGRDFGKGLGGIGTGTAKRGKIRSESTQRKKSAADNVPYSEPGKEGIGKQSQNDLQ